MFDAAIHLNAALIVSTPPVSLSPFKGSISGQQVRFNSEFFVPFETSKRVHVIRIRSLSGSCIRDDGKRFVFAVNKIVFQVFC